jgi:hypothetical protein
MPGIWSARVDGPEGSVELVDVEPGRATWRVRAGATESPAAAPLRELTGGDARRVLFAVGAGVAAEKRPRGIATAGGMAVPVHGGADSGVLLVAKDGALSIARATDNYLAPEDLLELPIVLWDGVAQPATPGTVAPRSALGLTAGGRVLFARGAFSSAAPLAEALLRAGCTRAVALDRGAGATAFLDRAGGSTPPRARYDETVLYAVASPLQPRGFRFDAATPVVAPAKH